MTIIPFPTNTSYHFFTTTITLPRTNYARPRCFRVFSQSNTETVQIRKCSPFLESSLLVSNNNNNNNAAVDSSDEWKVVPDIWRSSAEKYGDKVALVDQYHYPPSTITYNQVFFFFITRKNKLLYIFYPLYCSYTLFWYILQLEQAILDFAEGLRVIGVKPDEKLALFADNSCRWLVADQGVSNFFSFSFPLSVY